ncbi:MAG: hypothetical protein Kow00108_14550 [Calditrichia bacterium]
MIDKYPITLPEAILLMALKDQEGTVAAGSMLQFALAGAILAELLLNKNITIEEKRRSKPVTFVNDSRVSDVLLRECLEKIRSAKRKASLKTWVTRFSGIKQLKHRVAQTLCNKGILRADEQTILLIFKRKIYPELNPEPERMLIAKLREAIFTDVGDIEPEIMVLISLANGTGILKSVFGRKELKSRKKRLEQIINGELTGKAAKEAIDAMVAVVMMTAIMPAIIASTATH